MTPSRQDQPQVPAAALGPDPYKGRWSTLSNTTLGMLMATIDASIVLISLPDIFRGIQLNPLTPGNTSYFLWMLMGYMLVTAVLVVSFGRLGDMFGRGAYQHRREQERLSAVVARVMGHPPAPGTVLMQPRDEVVDPSLEPRPEPAQLALFSAGPDRQEKG